MTTVIDVATILRWRADPLRFIEHVLCDPESGRPFVLSVAERAFLERAFTLNESGKLNYPELVFGAIKKSGKSTLAGIVMLTMVLLYGGRFAEGYCVANDQEQAVARTFTMVRRIVEASPWLKYEARFTVDRVVFPTLDATIVTIASDAASAAGGNPTISCFDELWGYTSERSRRLWDEMIVSPARRISCRLTTSYAGFSGESTLLEELYKRGMALPEVGPSLRAGDGMLFAWHTEPIAPWQTEAWLAEMRRSLLPNAYLRMIENRFVTTESSFIDLAWWDACVDPASSPVAADPMMAVYVGVDASVKRDSTAIVAVTWDSKLKKVRLVFHRIYQPSPDEPLDFENTVEATVRDLRKRFMLRAVYYDPYQMAAVAQRLRGAGVPMEEFPQTVPNLTQASQNLYELIQAGNLVVYPNDAIRLAVSRAVAIETGRGWRISKDKQSHKIDVVVALAMAALPALENSAIDEYSTLAWVR